MKAQSVIVMKAQSVMKLKIQGKQLTVTTTGVLEPVNMVMTGSPFPFGDQAHIQLL